MRTAVTRVHELCWQILRRSLVHPDEDFVVIAPLWKWKDQGHQWGRIKADQRNYVSRGYSNKNNSSNTETTKTETQTGDSQSTARSRTV